MRIIQHNCRKAYPVTIAALEAGLSLKADIVCLQEPYIDREFRHGGFLIHWPEKAEQRNKRVAIAIRRDLTDQMNIEARTDLINHPYIMALDVWELEESPQRSPKRRTRLVNCYDNWVGGDCVWQGDSTQRRRAIEDVNWVELIQGRTLLLGDFNAHSLLWNPQARARSNAAPLEALIERFELLVENDPDVPTRPKTTPGISIIDLALTTRELGPLECWTVDTEHQTGSDHELIVLEWAPVNKARPDSSLEITGWHIQALQSDAAALKLAAADWEVRTALRPELGSNCTREEAIEEAEWLQSTLVETLNTHAKPLRVSAFSKRWWCAEIKEKRSSYARAKRAWKAGHSTDGELREARNGLYSSIRKAKRECWENFLTGGAQTLSEKLGPEDTARCWQALRYTNPLTADATPALSEPGGQVATSTGEKEAMIREISFPTTWNGSMETSFTATGHWHRQINAHRVQKALFGQAIKKAPGLDKINFRALRMLWSWNPARITALIKQCARLGIHPPTWKAAKGVILRKPNKPDYSSANAYRVITLLSCTGKIIEKLAADAIATHCEVNNTLHVGQMGSRKHRSAIDAVACLIQDVHQAWNHKQLAGALLLDVKGAFPFVNPETLLQRMDEMDIDADLLRWTQSFLTGRSIRLVLDGFLCPEQLTNSGLPQGSPVSPILFAIYLSGVFKAIESEVPEARALSFADDIGIVTSGSSVRQICDRLQKAAGAAEAWGHTNATQFDIVKTEAVLFTRKQGRRRRELVQEAHITVGGHRISFNQEATRWLGVWLDSGLTFKAHFQKRIQKAKMAEARVRALCCREGLSSGLILRIQVAAVQATALFGAELWWHGQKNNARELQQLINQQARAVTGAFRSTPIGPLLRDAGLEPAEIILQTRQQGYAARLLKVPKTHPAQSILPVSFRQGDRHAQPGEQPLDDREWASTTGRNPQSLGQHLARQLAATLTTDPSGGFEETTGAIETDFPGQIIVQELDKALETGRSQLEGLVLWSDGSRLENGKCGAGVAWQKDTGEWQSQGLSLGRGVEVFDAELTGVCEALKMANSMRVAESVTVLLDSQAAINRLRNSIPGPGQELALRAWSAAQSLMDNGREVTIRWIPGHMGIEGNEQADKAAKRAAARTAGPEDDRVSLAHVNRARTEAREARRKGWLQSALRNKAPEHKRTYRAQNGWRQDPALAAAPKKLACRLVQLKTGHAAVGAHLARTKARDNAKCIHCGELNETVRHALLECRKWRIQRSALLKALSKAGVPRISAAEESPESRLLGDSRATKALLCFLADTAVGCFGDENARAAARAQVDNERGLEDLDTEELEVEERRGEG